MNLCVLCTCQSESYILQAIQMALQPANVYHKMKSVFEKMEEGKLKGQAERALTLSNATKALCGQFSARLSHFKPFQGLKVCIELFTSTYVCIQLD